MRKGESLFNHNNCPIYFTPIPVNYPAEEFRDITDKVVPGIRPYYMISNYGRIFHKYKNKFLTLNVDSKGYLYKPLSTINGSKNCRIHRLVMMTFQYFDGCENILVNHKDGIKTNCFIWNLEWTTYSENTIHAINNNLTHTTKIYSDELVHDICKLLEDSTLTLNNISNQLQVPYSLIQAIQNKRSHTDISDSYNIKPRKINNNLTIDQVHQLCKYYESFPKNNTVDNYCKEGLIQIGIKEPSTREIRTASKIYQKDSYEYISKEYNF